MKMLINENILTKMTYASLWSLALFSFVSLSASALSHILIFIPGLYFAFKAYKNGELNLSKSSIALLLTIIFAIVSIMFAPDITRKFKQVTKLKYMLIGVLAIYPYAELFKSMTRKQTKKMLNVFFTLLAIGNVAGIYALFSGYHPLRMKEASDGLRAAGMYGMAITYGYGVELILILMITAGVIFRKKITSLVNPWIFYISLVTTFAGFYYAFARGAMLALIFSIPFIFFKRNKKIFIGLLSSGFVLMGVVTYLVFNGTDDGNRFLLRAKTTSNMIRLSQYQAAYKGFLEKPLTGWGYRNFEPNAYDIKKRNGIDFADFYGHAHNNYLEFLASTGIFGFTSFCAFVLLWLYEMYKRNDEFSELMIPFIISFSISGLFQNTINDGENMFVIMCIYSLCYSIKKKITVAE
jgi:O-antigen ligase